MQDLQSQEDDDDDQDLGAPAAATYEKKSVIPIEDILGGLNEKADGELADLRKAEAEAQNGFNMRKSSLEAKIGADTKCHYRQWWQDRRFELSWERRTFVL